MKLRTRNSAGNKIDVQMAPMIDVVFQLLIFFMLTLKIIEPEGDFDINMPLGRPAESAVSDADLPPLKVRMQADPATGELTQLLYNERPMGNGDLAFERLNMEILKSINSLAAAGPDNLDKLEAEIEPDYELDYKYIIAAISACSGKMTDGKVVEYIKRIKFAPIRDPQ